MAFVLALNSSPCRHIRAPFPLVKSTYSHPAEYRVFFPGRFQPTLSVLSLTQRQVQSEAVLTFPRRVLSSRFLSHVRYHLFITTWAVSCPCPT